MRAGLFLMFHAVFITLSLTAYSKQHGSQMFIQNIHVITSYLNDNHMQTIGLVMPAKASVGFPIVDTKV